MGSTAMLAKDQQKNGGKNKMKLKSIAKNQTEVTLSWEKLGLKTIFFYSYETPVAIIDILIKSDGTEEYQKKQTNEFYSQTTTKHINAFFKRYKNIPGKPQFVGQSEIDKIVK